MPNFKTDKEWFTEAKRLHKEKGLNAAQIKERIGFHEGFRIDNSSSQGIRKINLATKLKKDTKRNGKGKVPESTREFFPDDKSHDTYKRSVGRDKLGINARTRQASVDRGIQYHKGHIQSSEMGGSTTSRSLRLENGSNNSSHGKSSPPRGALLNTGTPLDWDGDAINYLDPSGLPNEYTPQDKQKILNAPADKVDEVTAEVDKKRWDAIKMNPDARPIRTNPNPRISNPPTKQNFHGLTRDAFNQGAPKPRGAARKISRYVPLAGAIAPLISAGDAFAKGNHAEGVVNVGEAIIGEIPFGDVAIESADAMPVADGTLTGRRALANQTPNKYSAQGPDVPKPEQFSVTRENSDIRNQGQKELLKMASQAKDWVKSLFIR